MAIINGTELMMIMRNTLNEIDTRLIDHGDRVAYMVWKTAILDSSLTNEEIRDITITSFLHDIGAYKTDEIDKMVEFETVHVLSHSIYGYLFLKYLAPLKEYARMILCHHVGYKTLEEYKLPEMKWIQILSIADRFDVAMSIYNDVHKAKKALYKNDNILFSHEILELFFQADDTQHFIDDIYVEKKELLFDILTDAPHSEEELRAYLNMVTYSIDFRSQYMVTHTMTTNCISLKIADIMGLSLEEKEKIDLGSILHDLGKVAIPIEILDFPGKLSKQQMDIMRTHVEFTEKILNHRLRRDIINIAIRHHEKLNGTGYPIGIHGDQININERIVAIADIISALYEQRSYKGALSKEHIIEILNQNVKDGAIDADIVNIAILHFDEIIAYVHEKCDSMIQIYQYMSKSYDYISEHFFAYLKKSATEEVANDK